MPMNPQQKASALQLARIIKANSVVMEATGSVWNKHYATKLCDLYPSDIESLATLAVELYDNLKAHMDTEQRPLILNVNGSITIEPPNERFQESMPLDHAQEFTFSFNPIEGLTPEQAAKARQYFAELMARPADPHFEAVNPHGCDPPDGSAAAPPPTTPPLSPSPSTPPPPASPGS